MAFKDFFSFRRMLTPLIIQILFWIGFIVCVIAGIITLFAPNGLVKGLETLILGPLLVRIVCELVILFFRINETLTDIRHALSQPVNAPLPPKTKETPSCQD